MFQGDEVLRFQDIRHVKLVRLVPYATAAFTPHVIFLVPISFRDWVDQGVTVRPEGLCQWKIPMTPSGTEPATFQLVEKCLNQLRYPHLMLPVLIQKYVFVSYFCLLSTHKCILFHIESHTQPYNKKFSYATCFGLMWSIIRPLFLKKPFSRNLKLQMPISIYLSFRSCDSCRRLPEPKHHSFLFNHWSVSKCLFSMAACTPSIHVFLGRPLFLLSSGIHSIINFNNLRSL